jgi:hypothetical protein
MLITFLVGVKYKERHKHGDDSHLERIGCEVEVDVLEARYHKKFLD